MPTLRPLLAAMAAAVLIAGCTPVYRFHGYVPPEEDLAMVSIGQTTEADLETLLGRPGSNGLLLGSGWYYVGSRWEHYGPRRPREIDRQVVAISFADNGTVSNVERFGLEQGRVVVLSRRVTDSGIVNIGLIRQLLGNIGNLSAGDMIGAD